MSTLVASTYYPKVENERYYAKNLRSTVKVSYNVVFIKSGITFGAHFPDVPGCVATSTDLGEVKRLIKEGLVLHLEGILEDGDKLPAASSGRFDWVPSGEDEVVEEGKVTVTIQKNS